MLPEEGARSARLAKYGSLLFHCCRCRLLGSGFSLAIWRMLLLTGFLREHHSLVVGTCLRLGEGIVFRVMVDWLVVLVTVMAVGTGRGWSCLDVPFPIRAW